MAVRGGSDGVRPAKQRRMDERVDDGEHGETPARPVRRRKTAAASNAVPAAVPAPTPVPAQPATRSTRPPRSGRVRARNGQAQLPAVAPCPELETLQTLTPAEARAHVERYLHAVMPASDADAFEASAYRWELHLIEIEQLQLVHGVDLDRPKLRRYGGVLRRGGGFPPLIGLGGDRGRVTEGVLLCDGYHRAVAMRDAGLHFVWAWLAVGMWKAHHAEALAVASGCGA